MPRQARVSKSYSILLFYVMSCCFFFWTTYMKRGPGGVGGVRRSCLIRLHSYWRTLVFFLVGSVLFFACGITHGEVLECPGRCAMRNTKIKELPNQASLSDSSYQTHNLPNCIFYHSSWVGSSVENNSAVDQRKQQVLSGLIWFPFSLPTKQAI